MYINVNIRSVAVRFYIQDHGSSLYSQFSDNKTEFVQINKKLKTNQNEINVE